MFFNRQSAIGNRQSAISIVMIPPSSFEPVIGLEVHAQLLTESKIFCGCSTRFGDPPNTHVCPVCLGLPGALPVLNAGAVEHAVRAALALNCAIQPVSVFARKQYFYPDLPKGYQITQYDRPLAVDGWIEVPADGAVRRVGIARLHLEEDAGKSIHGDEQDAERTCLDFNRSGVALIEVVTRPDLRSAAEAADCFSRLREVLVAVGVTDGNMEEGSLRCDANVSVRPAGGGADGVKVEVKNLNSFRHLQRALAHEIARQEETLAAGGRVVAETRLFDPASGRTATLRGKEEAHDYRYVPEPDLPPLALDETWIAAVGATLVELPDARRDRLVRQYGLSAYDADVLTRRFRGAADYFEAAVRAGAAPKAAANWILGEIGRALNEQGAHDIDAVGARVPPARLAELVRLVDEGRVSGPAAKDVFLHMLATGLGAAAIADREGLGRLDDEAALAQAVRAVVAVNAKAVADFRAGKRKAFGFLVGQAMKATGGRADPERLARLLEAALEPPRP